MDFRSSARLEVIFIIIHNVGSQLFGKGMVWGILQSTIRRNQPSMHFASYGSNPPLPP